MFGFWPRCKYLPDVKEKEYCFDYFNLHTTIFTEIYIFAAFTFKKKFTLLLNMLQRISYHQIIQNNLKVFPSSK